jgi:uncharacterized protein DUF4238
VTDHDFFLDERPRFSHRRVVKLKKQNQHELPEKYLRGFCQPGTSFLWVFREGVPYSPGLKPWKHNPFRSGIHQTASEINRYAARTMDGEFKVEHWEDQLQKREHAVDPILDKVRAKTPISLSEKEAFVDYLMLMWLRVGKRWQQAQAKAGKHVDSVNLEAWARQFAFLGRFDLANQVIEAESFLKSEDGTRLLVVESMMKRMQHCESAVIRMGWTFMIAAAPTFFITSDAPFIFDEALGLGKSFFQFPISSEVMLVGDYDQPTDLEFVNATDDEVLKLNAITMKLAMKDVYAQSNAKWIHDAWNYGVTLDSTGVHINGEPETSATS